MMQQALLFSGYPFVMLFTSAPSPSYRWGDGTLFALLAGRPPLGVQCPETIDREQFVGAFEDVYFCPSASPGPSDPVLTRSAKAGRVLFV